MSNPQQQSHHWTYQVDTILGTTETHGPVAEAELLQLASAGKIARKSHVCSATRTQGRWFAAENVPGLLQAIEQGERSRKAAKDAKRHAAEQAKQAQLEEQSRQRAAQERAAAEISDCQDASLVNTIRERVQGIITSHERVQYIVVQQKPLVNIAPDAVVCTNRRLIFYRPKLLGRFEFEDYQWFDLYNAHLRQNLLGAVFSAQHVSGRMVSMDYLPSTGAQALYRIAQEREEEARQARLKLQFDAARAGAAQVNVQTHIPTPTQVQNAPSTAAGDDLVKRLETLKSMLDKGLITAEEYSQRKLQILAQV